ncbi:RNA-binding signal recognition particle subunit srp14 [Halocaridina rubra]|uniref:Signal recognition particle 14 kDa protein n=1 Tax=Halocaridina rubra TaxID=373956 RepID=A0AAN9FTQ6_HALRR
MGDRVHLTNEVFMSELTLMFHNARKEGTVTTSIKRYDGRTRPIPKVRKIRQGKKTQIIRKEPLPTPDEFSCLIRAKSKSKKISTVISAEDAIRFQLQFCQFLRSNMDGLKKEKKTKKKSKKATQ